MKLYDENGKFLDSRTLAETSASRSSGFPKLVAVNNTLYLAWTDIQLKTIRTATIKTN